MRWMTWRAVSASPHRAKVGRLYRSVQQGLTLVHFSAELKRFLWATRVHFSA